MTNHEDYAHIRDPQTERTKWELWAIVAIIVAVLACSFVWRIATHHPAKPQTNWRQTPAAAAGHPAAASGAGSIPAAAAYSLAH